jgi:hypothetical protein
MGNNQERPTILVGVTPEIVLPGFSFRINTLKVTVMSVSEKPNEQHKNECGHNLVSITHNVIRPMTFIMNSNDYVRLLPMISTALNHGCT